jgi:Ca2+-transporting ATPase
MKQLPRDRTLGLFRTSELMISIIQGIIIAAGVLALYYFFMNTGHTLVKTRTIVFTTLVLSNIFLTFANRSFTQNFFQTIRYKNNLVVPVFIISVLFLAIIHLAPPVRNVFEMVSLTVEEFFLSSIVGFCSVMWFEIYKTMVKKHSNDNLLIESN